MVAVSSYCSRASYEFVTSTPDQFYDWKKKLAAGIGEISKGLGRRRRAAGILGSGAADEAKAFIRNKSALLDRLRSRRAELDQRIRQLAS